MSEKYKVLIGYDGSDYANEALADLQYAGLPDDSEAIIFCVSDSWDTPIIGSLVEEIAESADEVSDSAKKSVLESEKLSEQGVFRLRNIFPSWNVSAEDRHGKPAWEIIEKSDEWKANLIVVGSQGRNAIGRAVLGSVSQKVLNESQSPVRISRKREKDESAPVRILIAFDGSEYAVQAVQRVVNRSWSPETEFRVIIADNDPSSRPAVSLIDEMPKGKEDSLAAKEWIKKMVEKPAEMLKSAGLNSSQTIRWGDASQIILSEAENWKADSIFLGARGLGRFKRFLLGSVSSTVAANAKCSVEIVR